MAGDAGWTRGLVSRSVVTGTVQAPGDSRSINGVRLTGWTRPKNWAVAVLIYRVEGEWESAQEQELRVDDCAAGGRAQGTPIPRGKWWKSRVW